MNQNASDFLRPFLGGFLPWLYAGSYWWTVVGFTGNLLFGSRFIFQWIASERRHELVVPAYFWYLSFWGSVLNLLYAFHLDNAPLIFGVLLLPVIYGRNLVLLGKKGQANGPHRPSHDLRLASAARSSR